MMVEVTSVDRNNVGFERPRTFDFDPAIAEVQTRNLIEDNTLSGFTMVGPFGEADPGAFYNSSGQGQTMIMVGGTTGATLTNIWIDDGISHGVTFAGSIDATLDDFVLDRTLNKGAGRNRYAVWVRDVYESDFANLTISDTRHAVLFSSYTTASNNSVHVSYTKRDINFHGGRDQYKTVVVNEMVRNETEQSYMAWAILYIEGERHGAPTDPTTNPIRFGTLVATSKGDEAYASDASANLWMVGGNDTAHGGAGDDYINGGDGNAVIYGLDGNDTINGGAATDTLVLEGALPDYQITADGAHIYLAGSTGRTLTRNVESCVFADTTIDDDALLDVATVEDVPDTSAEPAIPYEEAASSGTDSTSNTATHSDSDTEPDTARADLTLPTFTWRQGTFWSSGFTTDIASISGEVMKDFQIIFSDPSFTISNIWGATSTVKADGALIISGSGYSLNAEPGKSISVGFNGNGSVPADEMITYTAIINGTSYVIGEEADELADDNVY